MNTTQERQAYMAEDGRRQVYGEHYLGIPSREELIERFPDARERTPSSTTRPVQKDLKDAVVLG